MSEICTICPGVSCENPPDLEAYSLQNNALYNAQYIFLVQCPTGYFCPAGLFPKYVTIKKNRKSIPFPPPGATSVSVQGCQSLIVIPIPSGSSTVAIQALMQAALLQWAAQQAICDSITENNLQPKTDFIFNDLVSATCSGGLLFRISYPYTLPPPVFAQGGKLWMKAGTTSASTKVEANAQAIAFLQSQIAAKISDGVIECGYWNEQVEFNCGLTIQTIPALTFFSTTSQADANAKAAAAAALQCKPMAICNWSDVLAVLPGGCATSTFPAWDGIFDLVNFDSFGDTIYYFIGKSIGSGAVAANESANVNYPNGNWQDTGIFTEIVGSAGSWQLGIFCTNGTTLWLGNWTGNERTPGDQGPAGNYDAVGGFGFTPDSICVQPISETNCNCCHITPDPLPDADDGVAYSEQLQLDGETQGTWSVTGGALPIGITLSSAGLLSGTPTEDGTFNFEVMVDGCVKDMTLLVTAAPFDCLGNPSDIQDATWVKGGTGGVPPCADIAITAGTGTWFVTASGSCIDSFVNISSTICNPGAAYDITVAIPWGDSGNVNGGFQHIIQFTLKINGVDVDQDTRDLVTGPFTPVSLVGTLPANTASNTVQILFVMHAVPTPSVEAHSNPTISITPLTHP